METLKEKTAKGLLWGGLNNFTMQLLGMVFGIILGRLLSPYDYGMMPMIAVFSLIATTLQDSGFKVALANQKEVRNDDYNSVFWFNVLVGGSMYAILFFCAPLIARYYHEPALVLLSRYAFLSIIFASLGTAQSAWLFRNLRAKQQAKASITATLLSSLIGVAMAWAGCSYWSLATQGLVYVLVNTLLQWHYSPWRPSWRINFGPVRRMFPFSVKLLLTTALTHINNNIMNILLGRYFTTQAVGHYNQAYQWNYKASYAIQGMITQVAQPVFTETSDERSRQLAILRKMMRFTAFISFPLLFGFSLVAKDFIVLAITDKWLVSAGYLQQLCIGGAFMPLSVLLSNYIISRGKSDTYLYSTLALMVCQLSLMLLLLSQGQGIVVMIWAYLLLNIGWMFVWHWLAGRLSGYTLGMLLRDIMPFCLSAAAVMVAVHFATRSIPWLWVLLLVRVGLAVLLYYGIMRLARVKILDDCMQFVKARFRR